MVSKLLVPFFLLLFHMIDRTASLRPNQRKGRNVSDRHGLVVSHSYLSVIVFT